MVESLSGHVQADAAPGPAARERAFHDPRTFVRHDYEERTADLGEVAMNYAEAGSPDNPALLLIPGQTESWWGYEKAMAVLAKDFHVFAVDLRGQGRSTWTPSRYTIDNMGGDLVRFIATVIRRPVVTSGCSSGGVLSAWLSAFALPGQLRGAVYEDPPLFACLPSPMIGPSIRQAIGPLLRLQATYLGDQWRIGDWEGLRRAMGQEASPLMRMIKLPPEPPQNLKEYDPEWARAFWEGTVARSCPPELMLPQVKVPVLLTHHARFIVPDTGDLVGAMSDLQAAKVRELIAGTGQPIEYVSMPDAAHALHHADPPRFAEVVTRWIGGLPA
jgi:pimeloyl-ACP methyl ester carboxylesterase